MWQAEGPGVCWQATLRGGTAGDAAEEGVWRVHNHGVSATSTQDIGHRCSLSLESTQPWGVCNQHPRYHISHRCSLSLERTQPWGVCHQHPRCHISHRCSLSLERTQAWGVCYQLLIYWSQTHRCSLDLPFALWREVNYGVRRYQSNGSRIWGRGALGALAATPQFKIGAEQLSSNTELGNRVIIHVNALTHVMHD